MTPESIAKVRRLIAVAHCYCTTRITNNECRHEPQCAQALYLATQLDRALDAVEEARR